MPKRYFLDKDGAKTSRIQGEPGAGHIDIAKEVLAEKNVAASTDQDLYRQMFRFKYVRIVEHDDGTVEAEHGPPLSPSQERVLDEFERQGKTVNIVTKSRWMV